VSSAASRDIPRSAGDTGRSGGHCSPSRCRLSTPSRRKHGRHRLDGIHRHRTGSRARTGGLGPAGEGLPRRRVGGQRIDRVGSAPQPRASTPPATVTERREDDAAGEIVIGTQSGRGASVECFVERQLWDAWTTVAAPAVNLPIGAGSPGDAGLIPDACGHGSNGDGPHSESSTE
jgi:hypothetical protein